MNPALEVSAPVSDSVSMLRGVELAELDALAALQTRVDRKYIVDERVFDDLVASFSPQLRALDIEGERRFGYRSVYFDTEDLVCFRAHLQRRRRRIKVRTRVYEQSGLCVLEVKTKGMRDATVKTRIEYPAHLGAVIDREGGEFIEHVVPGFDPDLLHPVIQTRYARTTLLYEPTRSRITCDAALTFRRGERTGLLNDRLVLIETKSTGGQELPDRWLWSQGARPVSISKYCVGIAMLHPDAKSNPWHRLLDRHFVWD